MEDADKEKSMVYYLEKIKELSDLKIYQLLGNCMQGRDKRRKLSVSNLPQRNKCQHEYRALPKIILLTFKIFFFLGLQLSTIIGICFKSFTHHHGENFRFYGQKKWKQINSVAGPEKEK